MCVCVCVCVFVLCVCVCVRACLHGCVRICVIGYGEVWSARLLTAFINYVAFNNLNDHDLQEDNGEVYDEHWRVGSLEKGAARASLDP